MQLIFTIRQDVTFTVIVENSNTTFGRPINLPVILEVLRLLVDDLM